MYRSRYGGQITPEDACVLSGAGRGRSLMKPVPRRLTRDSQCLPNSFPSHPPLSPHVDNVLQGDSQILVSCRCVFQDQQKGFVRDKLWVSDFSRYLVVVANFDAEGDAFVADKYRWPGNELSNVELGFSTK